MALLLRQVKVLVWKNLLLVFSRKSRLSTVLRAFVAPFIVAIYICFIFRAYFPKAYYGIGSIRDVRNLTEAMRYAADSRPHLLLVNNGPPGGDIDRVIDAVAAPLKAAGRNVTVTTDVDVLLQTCRSGLTAVTKCFGAAVFYSSPREGGIWNYTLRADASLGLNTVDVRKNTNDAQLFVLPLQHAIDSAIAGINSTGKGAPMPTKVQEFPFTSKTESQWEESVRQQLVKDNTNFVAVVWYLGLVGVTYQLVGLMAKERETEMSDLLESMMPNKRRWEPQLARLLSYHIAFTIAYGPSWIIMGIIAKIGLFTHSSGGVVVIGFLLAGLALVSFSILGASCFKKAQLSGISVVIIVLLLGIIAQIESKKLSTAAVAILAVFFTPMTFVNYLIGCTRWESKTIPVNLLKAPPNSPWQVPGIVFWICFILQIFCYPVFAALIERWLYGTAASRHGRRIKRTEETAAAPIKLTKFTKIYEPHPVLKSIFWLLRIKPEPVVAVNELTMSATKGEIMVLVGANGCGKSTTLNAVAGLGDITRGAIDVDGTGGIGLCPQKNVLWNPLTVRQHAQIFNGLKTSAVAAGKEDIAALVATCDLKTKIDTPSRDLSGGQKRKLQLIMMLTGGSRVCCVDEVSGGLDPLSRRKIWNILLAERGKRTVILTTHFLDEAEFLADHMVIMHKGELKAEGSVSELKSKLGSGYRVHVLPNIRRDLGLHDKHESRETIEEITKLVPDASAAIKEIEVLEQDGTISYQVTGPTIEEVFMKLATDNDIYNSTDVSERDDEDEASEEHNTSSAKHAHSNSIATSREAVGAFQQIMFLFKKRLTVLKRNPTPIIAALAIVVIGAGFVSMLTKGERNPGCALIDQVAISDNQNLTTDINPFLVVGPPSALDAANLKLVFDALPKTAAQTLGAGNGTFTDFIHTVDNLLQFNEFATQHQANITPGGLWLGDSSTPPTLNYRANIALGGGDAGIVGVYNAVFVQNILNILLTKTSIVVNYAVFDFPWPTVTTNNIQFVFYFGLILAAYPAFFALYPTRERLKNVRALEYSNGVRPFPLWFAYALFDFVVVSIASTAVTIIFAATSSDAWWNLGYLFLILLLYGTASILLSYVISLFAKSQLAAFAFSAGGQALMVVLYLTAYMTIQAQADPARTGIDQTIAHFTIGLITPAGQAVRALLVGLNLFSILCENSPPVKATDPGKLLLYGGPILYLICQSLFLFAILVWSDYRFSLSRLRRRNHNPSQRDTEDLSTKEPEVRQEIERVANSQDGLRVLHIDKTFSSWAYGKVQAVEDLTFGVKPGEVFALVGPNGAGKSTTISMLRGEIQPSRTSGELFIQNVSVLRDRKTARSHLGVCPQFDAMDQLSVREHLMFYAGIRGMSHAEADVDALIHGVGLTPFASRMGEKLSGGNKRKLSLAIALIGNPGVVLLDEPSSGMDPLAKRNMWRTLAKFRKNRSILLTTHSMEEADALASRVGVLAKRLLDVGTTAHLREKHGHGFHVHLVLTGAPNVSDEAMANVRTWLEKRVPGAQVEGFPYNGQMRFNIPSKVPTQPCPAEHEPPAAEKDSITPITTTRKERSVGELFAIFEEVKSDLGIEFYSVSPSTFDEVFLTVVEKHHVGEEEPPTRKKRWRLFKS